MHSQRNRRVPLDGSFSFVMPVAVNRVLNFSELITRAASERKRLHLHQISHSQRLSSLLNSSTISYEQPQPEGASHGAQEEGERGGDGNMTPEIILPSSLLFRRLLYHSAHLDYLLSSSLPILSLRALIYFLSFLLIALDTKPKSDLSPALVFKIQILNSCIDFFFSLESSLKIFSSLTRFIFPAPAPTAPAPGPPPALGSPGSGPAPTLSPSPSPEPAPQSSLPSSTLFLIDGLVELGTTIGSLIYGFTLGGAWFRLVRVAFLSVIGIRHAVHIDVLMSGITLGIRSLLSTWILISLIFAVYAACCMHFFGRNDPFHFGSMAMSIWTLFEMCTLDNWETVLRINMYGCASDPSVYFEWIPSSTLNSTTKTTIHQYGNLFLPVCSNSEAYPVLAVVIFISFILICAFVLMSIMIAVVTAGIRERIEEIQETISMKAGRANVPEAPIRLQNLPSQLSPKHSEDSDPPFSSKLVETFDPELVLLMLKQIWKHAAKEAKRSTTTRGNKTSSHLTSPSGRTYLSAQLSSISYWKAFSIGDNFKKQSIALRSLTNHPVYHFVCTLFIILAALFEIVFLQESKQTSSGNRGGAQTGGTLVWMEWFQYFFQAYFMFDIFLRVKAHYPDYLAFLRTSWNTFDVILVMLTLLPILATGTSVRETLGLFRVGRILRVLRLLTWVETLDIILKAISNSAKALVFVVILMAIFFYNYAIMGVFLFRGNDPHHFGTLAKALLTLFQVSTLSSWGGIARTNMYGCDLYGYDTGLDEYDMLCENAFGLGWFAAWYFVIFVMIGIMVLVSLFSGVIITSMDLLRDSSKAEAKVMNQAKRMQRLYFYDDQSFDNLLEIFEIIDTDSNGFLSIKELTPLLEMLVPQEGERLTVFFKADTDEDGRINFAEFFTIVDDLQRFYLANREAADRKAREGSEAREERLRLEKGHNPIMNLLKSSFLSSVSNLVDQEAGHLQRRQQQAVNNLSRRGSGSYSSYVGGGDDDGQVEVIGIDEDDIEDQVREFRVSAKSDRHQKGRVTEDGKRDCPAVLRIESVSDLASLGR